MQGKLIVIEGIDGSGKATQAELLTQYLQKIGKNAMKITFPDYDSPACGAVKMYLDGEFGKKPDDVNAYAAGTLYAVDRFASYKTNWGQAYENGAIIIADRYVTSNAVHQMAKMFQDEWDNYLDWLYDFEYNKIGLPRPDSVIYLNIDEDLSCDLIEKRAQNKDIHETDREFMQRSREAAKYAAKHDCWFTINCTDGENLLPREEITNLIIKALELC